MIDTELIKELVAKSFSSIMFLQLYAQEDMAAEREKLNSLLTSLEKNLGEPLMGDYVIDPTQKACSDALERLEKLIG